MVRRSMHTWFNLDLHCFNRLWQGSKQRASVSDAPSTAPAPQDFTQVLARSYHGVIESCGP